MSEERFDDLKDLNVVEGNWATSSSKSRGEKKCPGQTGGNLSQDRSSLKAGAFLSKICMSTHQPIRLKGARWWRRRTGFCAGGERHFQTGALRLL